MKSYRAYAKVNIFLKITGVRGVYHELISRFMRVESLYDELSFTEKDSDEFQILGNFSCTTEQNTIYKAYLALQSVVSSEALVSLMKRYSVSVKKSIPAFAGLGGGSSDAATYLIMCNEILDLRLSKKELANIGLKVGADVPFFIYGYSSANVSGIGEIVKEFKERVLNIETYTPKVEISTPRVYKIYRENFFSPISAEKSQELQESNSIDILNSMNPREANDLFAPALQGYSELNSYYKEGYHFSGSGSSFFRVKEEV